MKVPFNDLQIVNRKIRTDLEHQFQTNLDQANFIGGPSLSKFESSFAEYIGAKFCIGTGNCTDALELILEAYGIGKNDEVIIPAYTWVSSASCVVRVGAQPVFVDVHPEHYTIDVELIEAGITSKTKAIIAVHFYGLPAEMEEIRRIGSKYGLKIIEDCAQATGAEYKKMKVGNLGDAAAFSFYPTKNLGAFGDGGCIVTNDKALNDKIRELNNHGQSGKNKHRIVGRNSRLDSLQAAFLSVKLKYLDDFNEERILAADRYLKQLNGNLVKLPTHPDYSKHVYHLFVIQVEGNYQIQGYLEEHGIQAFIHYPLPLPELQPFEVYKQQGQCFSTSKRMACRILSLPMFPGITNKQIDYVCDNIRDAIAFCG